MASVDVVEHWAEALSGAGLAQVVCEVLATPHPGDDHVHLDGLVKTRLGFPLRAPARSTFSPCGWSYARAYLLQHLSRSPGTNRRMLERARIMGMLRRVEELVPAEAPWYASEHTHEQVTVPQQLLGHEARVLKPLGSGPGVEVCIAGLGLDRSFLFYARDARDKA